MLLSVVALAIPLTQVANANHGVCDLNITPENDTNPTGTTHTLTATLVEDSPSAENAGVCNDPRSQATNVDFEIDCVSGAGGANYTGETGGSAENATAGNCGANDAPGAGDDIRTSPDLSCVIPANSGGSGDAAANSCTVSYTRDTDGQDEIVGWVDEDLNDTTDNSDPGEAFADNDSDSTDAVAKFWSDQTQQQIDCTPEGDINPAGTQHTVTCTVRSAAGANPNLEGADVDYQVTGANPTGPQHGCTTGANGTCSFTYTGNNAGNDVIQAFVNQDGNHTNNDCGAEATADATNDDFCDQVEKTWQAQSAALVNAEPETDTNPNGTTHQVTATVRNQFGNLMGAGTSVTMLVTSGPNTGASDTCSTAANGQCTLDYTDAAAFDQNNATDTICVYITAAGQAECNTEPSNETEEANDPNAQPIAGTGEGNDAADVVLKTWTAPAQTPATQINAVPETDTNPVGTQHVIGVFAGNANNQGTTGSTIRADILPGSANANTGSGQAEINCPADPNPLTNRGTLEAGQTETHECAYTGNNTGTDNIRVFADTNNNQIFDQGEPFDDVVKIWSGQAFALVLTPESDTANAGTCNEFTARVTDQQGNPVVGQIVDVEQVLQSAGTEPNETRELSFCNPQNATGPNPTGQGGTAFGDVSGNNQGQTAGQAGRNTTVRGEVGPTNTNGEVTFGIFINSTTANATVNVRAWVDLGGDNDTFNAGEPTDTSVKTWTPGGIESVTGLDATPESATNPNGTTHQVTVTLTGASGPIQGVTPNSIIASNAAGRPQGDVADANAGTSPNAAANTGNFQVYNCTASNAQGVSTCTFQDLANTPAGTDTIVFYVNQASGGTAGPDANEPQDAVQKTWTAGPQNLALDLQCAGTGTGDDLDVGENAGTGNQPGGSAENGTVDCSNPVSDQDEVFTAFVTTQAGVGQPNVRVDFQFGNRTNGNAAGANNSTDDATLNATPGGQIGTQNPPGGPPLQTFCLTNANGTCSVTLTNPTPQAGDTVDVTAFISGQTTPVIVGGTRDTATKQWQAGAVNQVGRLTLTPRAATNQVGTPHTVTATVLNQFGQPVQGANVDFRITGGPNAGLAQAGMTDAVTNAAGQATFTYTSNAVGQDVIVACTETGGSENDQCDAGEPNATATKNWQTGAVTTGSVSLDMQSRVPSTAIVPGPPTPPGADTAADDCEADDQPNNTARETTASNQINPNQGTGAAGSTNFHEICAAAFQTNAQTATPGAQITFTLTGVGRLFATTGANDQCSTATVPPAATTLTVTADSNGVARACLFSQQVGRSTVTASSGNPAVSDTGTKDWTVNPATARFIQLCHGDVAGTTCVTENQTNEPNDEHQLTARVTDRQGNPVAGVPVQFRETGPGIFTPQGGSTATVNTDANGLASVLLTSDVVGDSTIVAEISPQGTAGGFRGAAANDDECEQPAGTNNQPAAGNCVSQTLTKLWRPPTVEPECDNGEDDDGDGFIDEEDPSCDDGTEAPQDPPVFDRNRHERRISIRFNDGTGARNNGLVVFGRVRLGQDGTNPECFQQVPVNVQRRINGRWVTKKTTTTNRRGRYAVEIFDQASRYRAIAPRHEIVDDDARTIDICLKAVKAKRHRHRR